MSQKFQPESTQTATPEQLEEIAIIRVRDWRQAIATADPTLKPYLEARIDRGQRT